MKNCKECNNELFQNENSIGKPFEYDICSMCWEDLPIEKIEYYKQDGVIPITRSIVTEDWKTFCNKFGFKA